MSRYTYRFPRVDEEFGVDREVDEPLTNIAVGNYLILPDEHLGLAGGCHFLIRDIEVFVSSSGAGTVVTVHIEQVDRGVMLRRHRGR
jgi:hypothetical protein